MKKGIAGILVIAMLLTLAACGGKEAAEPVDLTALYGTWEELLPEMFLPEGEMRLNYLGIDEGDCLQVLTAVSADGLAADEVWLIQAKDAAALKRLTEAAENRLAAKAEETVDYNPAQYAIVKEGKILTIGNYLILLVSPKIDEMKSAVEAVLK